MIGRNGGPICFPALISWRPQQISASSNHSGNKDETLSDTTTQSLSDTASSDEEEDPDHQMDIEMLRQTENKDNPFDLRTEYGKYISILAILTLFTRREQLEVKG